MRTIEGDNYDHDAVSGLTPHDIEQAHHDAVRGAANMPHIGLCGTCGCEVGIQSWNENNGQCWRHADHTKRWTD